MASYSQFCEEALAAGFVGTDCVHPDHDQHRVFDYPRPLGNGTTGRHWRVHINLSGRTVVYIGGHDTPQQRVSFKNAIDFVHRVSLNYPQG
jgi:hypothetical protein